ncbi:MAG TPA: N-acetyldiaminopimelate deacetylase [Bacillus sp. (in: firmicutes)]|uniref:N-acetyldiaminopimelate deacetylase n=1 Tax=Bacillus litorisediminis TaxID=2922713 RepID=UPI001FAED930|nr:N-acetyldiaminopimelate deacetylase [Bacillus litorisediminis]HWO74871.1 N-acetyldiaminopimelate deacetylase [Bacillus sp. (in: firmicutes)]
MDEKLKQKFISIRRDLHQIPEKGFEEYKTQKYLMNYLQELPAERLEIKVWKTGIFVKVKGLKPNKTFGYRADMDGLPMQELTELPFSSQHDGMMHACGHDFHMAIGLGVLTALVFNPIQDDVIFLFQPAEEGPGGAKPMIESDIFAQWRPDEIVALHIAPEYPVGTIATKPGLLFANTSELFIDLKGKGGHAAYPHHANDMVVAASQLVSQFQTVISRNIDPLDSAVITIGKITGGFVQNVIAEEARLEGTIRTLSEESMGRVKQRIEAIVKGIEAGFECKAAIDYGSMYHQVYNHELLTQEFMNFANGHVEVIECKAAMTGEDFGYMVKEVPGFMFWLGVNSPYGLHHQKLNPNEEAIEVAISLLTSYFSFKSQSS